MKKVLIISLFGLGFISCKGEVEPEYYYWSYFDQPPEPIELILETNKRSNSIALDLYLVNNSDTTLNLIFAGYQFGQPYNFIVIQQDSSIVWQEYRGTIDLVGTIVPIEPGRHLVHSGVWDFDSNFGRRITKDNEYTIYGYGEFGLDWDLTRNLNEPGVYVSNPEKVTID